MAAYPDVEVTGVRPLLGSDSWDTLVQFSVGLKIDGEGAAGSFHFWLEFDTADYERPMEIGERLLLDPLGGGAYAIEVPPEGMVLPRFVFETPGGYLRVIGHYMPPDGSSPIDVLVLTYSIAVNADTETFKLKSLGARGTNPMDVRPPPPAPSAEEPSEDDGGFVVGRDSESSEAMEEEEESAPAGSESLGEESDMEDEEEQQEVAGRKRGHEDEGDEDADLPYRKRPRFECANCLRKATLMCGRCRTTYYCNKDCQAAHYGEHAQACCY